LRRRRIVVATTVLIVLVGGGVIIARSLGNGSPTTTASPPRSPRVTTTAVTTTIPPTTTTTTDPGSLPQSESIPTSTDPLFTARMSALWAGVMSDSSSAALPAFFPESAYVRLKTVASAQTDYTARLLVDYQLDLAAAHALLGADAAGAALVGVNVNASYGHWVPPGICANDVGYFEVPNARMIYTVNGQTRSFGIASMISWRGQWYVVHLGSVLRSGAGGEVDDPEVGPGTSAYSGTC
jgi:hypothetical protein